MNEKLSDKIFFLNNRIFMVLFDFHSSSSTIFIAASDETRTDKNFSMFLDFHAWILSIFGV